MKKTTYTRLGTQTPIVVTYDETAPCRLCGFPVMEASTSGTDGCPWCDMEEPRPEEAVAAAAIAQAQHQTARQALDVFKSVLRRVGLWS